MAEIKRIGALYCVLVGDTIVFRTLTRAHAVAHAALWNTTEEREYVWKQTSLTLEEAKKIPGARDAKHEGVNGLGEPVVLVLVPR